MRWNMKKLVQLVMLTLVSCASQQFERTDPTDFCGRFEACIISMGDVFTDKRRTKCATVASTEDAWRDACVVDCGHLPPCAFMVCMHAHLRTASLASGMTGGK